MKAQSKSQKHRTHLLKRNMILSNSSCMGTITSFFKTTHVENFTLTLIVFETYMKPEKVKTSNTHNISRIKVYEKTTIIFLS